MVPIHNRMPVVIETADWPVWLGEEEGDPAALLRPAGDDVLRSWPVQRACERSAEQRSGSDRAIDG